MRKAEYPERTCREYVSTEPGLGYSCELPLLHPGPCASYSSRDSVERRETWEEQHPNWEQGIGKIDDIV